MQKSKTYLSIVIVSYNTKNITLECIDSINKNTKGINYEIIVVDNNSNDGSQLALKRPDVNLISNHENVGFAKANNQAVKVAKGELVLFLNSDTIIRDNCIAEIALWMKDNPKVGVSTPALKNKDGSLQATGGYFPTLASVFSWMTIQDLPLVDKIIKPFHPYHSKSFFSKGDDFYSTKKELDWVTGAFLMTRRQILEKINGWDEDYYMYVEEVDLCYRIKKNGYEVWYLPEWNIIHLGGASSKTNEFSLINEYRGMKTFYLKHYSKLKYQILRLLLIIGALGRIIVFGIVDGRETAKIYAKAIKIV